VSARCIAFLLLSTLLRSQSPSPYAGRPNLAGFGAMRPSGYPNDSFDAPLTFDFPEPAAPKPMAATVSLRELEQSIPEKALRAADEGHRYALQNNTRKAIQKFERAIRLAPGYRDAHNDLGVQYAQAKRYSEARAEFQKALEIGPPAAPIYLNLGLSSAVMGYWEEAQALALQALQLDSGNAVARQLLQYASER